MMDQGSDGSIPQCLDGVMEASVYSHLSTYTSQMLTNIILFYSDKHRDIKEIWKFAVHLDTWCYSLFVSEKVNCFVML